MEGEHRIEVENLFLVGIAIWKAVGWLSSGRAVRRSCCNVDAGREGEKEQPLQEGRTNDPFCIGYALRHWVDGRDEALRFLLKIDSPPFRQQETGEFIDRLLA